MLLNITGEDQQHYKEGRVDSNKFRPECYTAEVKKGDLLIFTDTHTAHELVDTSALRQSYTQVYGCSIIKPNS